MITIQSSAEKAINNNPFLKELLLSNYANLSAIAKTIKKDVESDLLKQVSLNSLVVALNRIKSKLAKKSFKISKIFDSPPEITIRSKLVEIVTSSEENEYRKLNELALKLETKEEFFALSKGFYEITAIFPEKYLKYLKTYQISPKKIFKNITLISLKLPPKIIEIPGVYYKILQFIAFENIPLIEVFSTYTELMLFVDEKYEEGLFKSIRKLIKIL